MYINGCQGLICRIFYFSKKTYWRMLKKFSKDLPANLSEDRGQPDSQLLNCAYQLKYRQEYP